MELKSSKVVPRVGESLSEANKGEGKGVVDKRDYREARSLSDS